MSAEGKMVVERLRGLAPEDRRAALEAAGEDHVKALDDAWPVWAHRGQMPDHDEWTVWVMLTGRGFGKTRAGAEWVSEKARTCPEARIALVAANPKEARRVMVEGRSGLLGVAREGDERRLIRWEPGIGRVRFASGAEAFVYSGADGDSLRGGEHHYGWCDELAKWRQAKEAWDNLMLTMRAGTRPQVLVTTTPRPVEALRAVLRSPDMVLTGGTSFDNPHLPEAFLRWANQVHRGTRLGRQELLGELLEDLPGALWPLALIEESRETGGIDRERLKRVVVGVDPPVTADGDECGIVACGLGRDGIARVLGDHSGGGLSPEQWARKVAAAAEAWRADRVVAEGNQGGEMVDAVLRGAGLGLAVKRVFAKSGKARRAEPIAAFFESGEAKLAGRFPELEKQLAGLVLGGDYQGPGRSPDRADAMIWAMSELLLAPRQAEPRIRSL
ncbi:MAG TPA: terminase family protein [Allosphingosinicella sp.]|nr:terminase family protein [Allosphingosinicella sp.]